MGMNKRDLGERLGRCGFCRGVCPTLTAGRGGGCDTHRPGECFTRDCTERRGLPFPTLCGQVPCEELTSREKATILDKAWLQWKRREVG